MSNKQGNQDDGLFVFIFVIAAIGIFLWFSIPIFKEFFLTLKLWQLEFVALLVPQDYNMQLLQELRNRPSYSWTLDQVVRLGYVVNYYFLPLVLGIVYFTSLFVKKYLYVTKNYKKEYLPKDLLAQEKKIWRFLVPIADLDLLEQNQLVGPWASAKKPQEIAIQYKLLNNEKDLNSLNEEKAAKYFAMQLGNIYTGLDNLPTPYKALVGCFAAQYMSENNKAYDALGDISETATSIGKIDFSSGLKLFEQYKDEPKVIKLMNNHAYINTAIARLFAEAKEKGIMITKYFVWLKEYDRRLYYILNNMGREVAFTECAGIFDHYQYEVRLKRPMARVFVENAVFGLKQELKTVKLRDTD